MTRFLFAVIMLVGSNASTVARTYTDQEFGFRTTIPTSKVVCLPEGHTSDHGFVVLWETKECHFGSDPDGIYVYASHNYENDSNTTFELGKHLCHGNRQGLSPFAVSGFQFRQCKSRTDDGRASLDYFVLRHVKGGYPASEPTYGVTLICPHDDCRKLMPMTRWIFAHMKFIKQE